MLHDIRFACRALAKAPGFTVAAVLSLAIGIGACTSIFSVASALFLRPLRYADADRLVLLWNRSPGLSIAEDWFSTAQYFDIKTSQRGFEDVAIAIGANYNLTGDGEPERVGTIRVSSNLLPMLGARPALGRLFLPADDVPGTTGAAVLGYGTWIRRYGGDPGVIGRAMTLNGLPYEIVGVLPQLFDLPREVMPTLGGAEHAEVLLPLPLAADAASIRNREDYNLLAKLKRGVALSEAQAEMDAITSRLRRDHPEIYPPNGGLTFSLVPLQEQVVGDTRRPLWTLMAAVGFVLLIACVNVANLLLSRALARDRELAVRAALGATRSRIVGQLLTESVILAGLGGALGLLLAIWSVGGLRALGSSSVPRLDEIGVDVPVLLFTLGVSLLSAILFGLAPAIRVSRLDLRGQLRGGARGSAHTIVSGRGHHLRQLLVVAEIGLSMVLLVGAGLLIRSFSHLLQVQPGFNPAHVLTLELTMTGQKYVNAQAIVETYRQLWERLERMPGVTAAGGVSALPLSQMMAWGPIVVEGREPAAGEPFINADIRIVGGNYFRAMEIPLLAGRFFTEHDSRTSMRVVLIDDHMARQLWPGEDPVGKRIRTGGMDATADAPWMTIVGVVGRVKQDRLDAESRIAVYHPHAQFTSRAMNVVLRSERDAASLASTAREAIRALDPALPVYGVRTMVARVDASLARRRFSMLLLTLFAGLALALAAVGTYGVLTYLVNQGTRELGIRMALGATPGGVLLVVVRQAALVALAGVVTGSAGALVLTRFVQTMLVGIAPADPLTFTLVSLLLMLVALAAAWLPARRAARIDPIVSLRSE